MRNLTFLLLLLPFLFACSDETQEEKIDKKLQSVMANHKDWKDQEYTYLGYEEYNGKVENTAPYLDMIGWIAENQKILDDIDSGELIIDDEDRKELILKDTKENIKRIEADLDFFISKFITPIYIAKTDYDRVSRYAYINSRFEHIGLAIEF